MPHASDPSGQRVAEPLIVDAVEMFLGAQLAAETITLGDEVTMQMDGAPADRFALVEAYAHVGPLHSGQSRELTKDAFKLVCAGDCLGATRLVIAVADSDAAAYLLRPRA